MSSRNVYDFSQEQKAVVWLRVVYSLLFDQTNAAFEMCLFSLRWPRFLGANKSVYMGKEFSSNTNMSFVSLCRK